MSKESNLLWSFVLFMLLVHFCSCGSYPHTDRPEKWACVDAGHYITFGVDDLDEFKLACAVDYKEYTYWDGFKIQTFFYCEKYITAGGSGQ